MLCKYGCTQSDDCDGACKEEVDPSASGTNDLVCQTIWKHERALQNDSYASCRIMVHSHLKDGVVKIELTNGARVWFGEVPLPKGFGA